MSHPNLDDNQVLALHPRHVKVKPNTTNADIIGQIEALWADLKPVELGRFLWAPDPKIPNKINMFAQKELDRSPEHKWIMSGRADHSWACYALITWHLNETLYDA